MFNKKHKIGDIISKLRKEKGLTQGELAEKLKVSDKAISKWESNKGDPSIEFFPLLAEIFEVTIDYLMTGKEQKEKFITISNIELCAKKDDINMYKSLNYSVNNKDENGKTILDYIFKYESKNLFKFLYSKETIIAGVSSKKVIEKLALTSKENCEAFYYMRLLINDESIIRDLIRLKYVNSTINNHLDVYENFIGYNGSKLIQVPRKIVSDRMIDYILYSKDISSTLKNNILSNIQDIQNRFFSPAFSYPYFVLYSAKKQDWKLSKQLLENALKINLSNSETTYVAGTYLGFIDLPKDLFDILLENEKYDLIELANKNNSIYKEKYSNNSLYKDIFVLSSYDIEANKIKHDKKLSDKEKSIKLCIREGILNIDELLSTKDYELIKDNLYKYPINFIEIFSDMIKKKDYKNLFKMAVDMGLDTDSIMREKLDEFSKKLINEFWFNGKASIDTWGRRPVDELKSAQKDNFKYIKDWQEKRNYSMYIISDKNLTIDDIIIKLKESRDILMQDLAFEEEKNKITKDLSKEFFERELEKNNIDRVVINLCVKLEAILKYDFKYEGDFQEMLSKYCNKNFETYDDESNYYDPKTPMLLNKLRVYRNGIVHAETSKENLTRNEIEYCINFICNLEKKVK